MKLILLMAMTLDGKIAKSADHFPDWTGSADKKLFARLSRQAGVVIMGSKTFDTIGKPLPDRKNIILSRDKTRSSKWDNLVYTDRAPGQIMLDLKQDGFQEAVLAGGATVNSLFAEAGLIDEIIITVSPKIFGRGISLFATDVSMELELKEMEKPDSNLVYLRYCVQKN